MVIYKSDAEYRGISKPSKPLRNSQPDWELLYDSLKNGKYPGFMAENYSREQLKGIISPVMIKIAEKELPLSPELIDFRGRYAPLRQKSNTMPHPHKYYRNRHYRIFNDKQLFEKPSLVANNNNNQHSLEHLAIESDGNFRQYPNPYPPMVRNGYTSDNCYARRYNLQPNNLNYPQNDTDTRYLNNRYLNGIQQPQYDRAISQVNEPNISSSFGRNPFTINENINAKNVDAAKYGNMLAANHKFANNNYNTGVKPDGLINDSSFKNGFLPSFCQVSPPSDLNDTYLSSSENGPFPDTGRQSSKKREEDLSSIDLWSLQNRLNSSPPKIMTRDKEYTPKIIRRPVLYQKHKDIPNGHYIREPNTCPTRQENDYENGNFQINYKNPPANLNSNRENGASYAAPPCSTHTTKNFDINNNKVHDKVYTGSEANKPRDQSENMNFKFPRTPSINSHYFQPNRFLQNGHNWNGGSGRKTITTHNEDIDSIFDEFEKGLLTKVKSSFKPPQASFAQRPEMENINKLDSYLVDGVNGISSSKSLKDWNRSPPSAHSAVGMFGNVLQPNTHNLNKAQTANWSNINDGYSSYEDLTSEITNGKEELRIQVPSKSPRDPVVQQPKSNDRTKYTRFRDEQYPGNVGIISDFHSPETAPKKSLGRKRMMMMMAHPYTDHSPNKLKLKNRCGDFDSISIDPDYGDDAFNRRLDRWVKSNMPHPPTPSNIRYHITDENAKSVLPLNTYEESDMFDEIRNTSSNSNDFSFPVNLSEITDCEMDPVKFTDLSIGISPLKGVNEGSNTKVNSPHSSVTNKSECQAHKISQAKIEFLEQSVLNVHSKSLISSSPLKPITPLKDANSCKKTLSIATSAKEAFGFKLSQNLISQAISKLKKISSQYTPVSSSSCNSPGSSVLISSTKNASPGELILTPSLYLYTKSKNALYPNLAGANSNMLAELRSKFKAQRTTSPPDASISRSSPSKSSEPCSVSPNQQISAKTTLVSNQFTNNTFTVNTLSDVIANTLRVSSAANQTLIRSEVIEKEKIYHLDNPIITIPPCTNIINVSRVNLTSLGHLPSDLTDFSDFLATLANTKSSNSENTHLKAHLKPKEKNQQNVPSKTTPQSSLDNNNHLKGNGNENMVKPLEIVKLPNIDIETTPASNLYAQSPSPNTSKILDKKNTSDQCTMTSCMNLMEKSVQTSQFLFDIKDDSNELPDNRPLKVDAGTGSKYSILEPFCLLCDDQDAQNSPKPAKIDTYTQCESFHLNGDGGYKSYDKDDTPVLISPVDISTTTSTTTLPRFLSKDQSTSPMSTSLENSVSELFVDYSMNIHNDFSPKFLKLFELNQEDCNSNKDKSTTPGYLSKHQRSLIFDSFVETYRLYRQADKLSLCNACETVIRDTAKLIADRNKIVRTSPNLSKSSPEKSPDMKPSSPTATNLIPGTYHTNNKNCFELNGSLVNNISGSFQISKPCESSPISNTLVTSDIEFKRSLTFINAEKPRNQKLNEEQNSRTQAKFFETTPSNIGNFLSKEKIDEIIANLSNRRASFRSKRSLTAALLTPPAKNLITKDVNFGLHHRSKDIISDLDNPDLRRSKTNPDLVVNPEESTSFHFVNSTVESSTNQPFLAISTASISPLATLNIASPGKEKFHHCSRVTTKLLITPANTLTDTTMFGKFRYSLQNYRRTLARENRAALFAAKSKSNIPSAKASMFEQMISKSKNLRDDVDDKAPFFYPVPTSNTKAHNSTNNSNTVVTIDTDNVEVEYNNTLLGPANGFTNNYFNDGVHNNSYKHDENDSEDENNEEAEAAAEEGHYDVATNRIILTNSSNRKDAVGKHNRGKPLVLPALTKNQMYKGTKIDNNSNSSFKSEYQISSSPKYYSPSSSSSHFKPHLLYYEPILEDPAEKFIFESDFEKALKIINEFLTIDNESIRHTENTLCNMKKIVAREWFKLIISTCNSPSASTTNSQVLSEKYDEEGEAKRIEGARLIEFHLDHVENTFGPVCLLYLVNCKDEMGNTALHYSISFGNFDVVSTLLDSKECDYNCKNNAGYTPLMLSMLSKIDKPYYFEVVTRLIQLSDVNIKATQNGQTALMLAASHGRYDLCQTLLEVAGADINIQDSDGSTALMCASEHGYSNIAKLLLTHPDIDTTIKDNDGSNALAIAVKAGFKDIGILIYAHQNLINLNSINTQLPFDRDKLSASLSRIFKPKSSSSINGCNSSVLSDQQQPTNHGNGSFNVTTTSSFQPPAICSSNNIVITKIADTYI